MAGRKCSEEKKRGGSGEEKMANELRKWMTFIKLIFLRGVEQKMSNPGNADLSFNRRELGK